MGFLHVSTIKNGDLAPVRIWEGSSHLVILSSALKHPKMEVYASSMSSSISWFHEILWFACPRILKGKTCDNQFVAMLKEDWPLLSSGLRASYVDAETCPILSYFNLKVWNKTLYRTFPFLTEIILGLFEVSLCGSEGNSRSSGCIMRYTHHVPYEPWCFLLNQIIGPHPCI